MNALRISEIIAKIKMISSGDANERKCLRSTVTGWWTHLACGRGRQSSLKFSSNTSCTMAEIYSNYSRFLKVPLFFGYCIALAITTTAAWFILAVKCTWSWARRIFLHTMLPIQIIIIRTTERSRNPDNWNTCTACSERDAVIWIYILKSEPEKNMAHSTFYPAISGRTDRIGRL